MRRLRRIEDAARSGGGGEVVNVCLRKPDGKGHERVSLDRLLNRVNTSVKSAGRHAFLIFDEGKERMITRVFSLLSMGLFIWGSSPSPLRAARIRRLWSLSR